MALQIKNSLGTVVATVSDFTFTELDMGDATITCDVKFQAATDPSFALTWYVTFKGENFYLATLKPPAVKDTSSLYYTYSLTFKSERENLKRYMMSDFAEMPIGETALVPQSTDFSFYGDLEQFKDRFNLNLAYWFGSRWEMEINPSYTPDTTVLVTCNYTYLWDLLAQVYDIFGVRWYIAEETGVMKIKVAYAPEEITHIFEYGKSSGTDKGLVSVTRNNPLNDIYTRMSGKGSSRNVPSNYFKDATTEFPIADPDRNDLLKFVYFPNLMPKMYRDYMKGWNQSEAEGERLAGQTDAWYQGYDDEDSASAINPTDYLLSDNASIYGVRCGVLEPNEDIYPTLQGATDGVLGELDAVIAVEEVTNDVYEEDSSYYTIDGDSTEDIPSISANLSVNYNDNDTVSKVSDTFFVLEADNKIDFKFSVAANTIDQGWGSYEIDPSYGFTVGVVVSLHKASDDSLVDSYSVSAAMSGESSFSNVTADEYYLKITTTIDNDTTVDEPARGGGDTTVYYDISTVTSLGNVKIYDYGTETAIGNYKQTFDIWIKNVWGSTKDGGETDEEYVHRIWDPLLTVQDITVMWSDGMLAGDDYEFKVAKINGIWQIFYDTSKSSGGVDSEWRLTLIKSDAELEASKKQLPNISQNSVEGDHFFFININMPYDPYVYAAEERVQEWIEDELSLVDGEFPTYSITPSKIFMDSFADVELLRAGNLVRLKDVRLIGATYITQHITSLVLNYTASSMLPEWELTISDAVTVNNNPISLLQGQINQINSNASAKYLKIEDIAKSLNGTFLRKDGVADTSYSATTFKEGVTIEKSVVSDDFVRGDFGGTGMGLYRDANGATVVEADKFVARKEMRVNELIINQAEFLGGKKVYSAAGIEVTAVTDETTSFRLYFDTKNGTRPNQFTVNDQAFCQRYDPNTGSAIKYYWSLVTAVGVDYIEIDKTDSDGAGMPTAGDTVVQMGHRTNAARQSCLIIDQLNGGSVVQYAGISGFSLTDKNFVGYGVNPSTGEAYNYTYGESYFGDRDIDDPDATFVTFQQKIGDTAKKVYIKGEVTIGSGSSGLSNLSEWSDVETTLGRLQDQIDGQIIAWFQEYDPTLLNYPVTEWTTDALKDQHLNDTFTNTLTGGCWRFQKVAGVYSWGVIADTATQQALVAAAAAQDTADGKKRVFTATPTTPYDVGDLWSGLSAGDLKVCTTARASGAYVAGDWVLASKYTDDTTALAAQTAANNAQTSANTANSLLSDIASDSKLTPSEKQATKLEWDVIVAEKSKIDAQADYYGVSKTAYGTAYTTLSSYITPLLADLAVTSNITGTTFRSNFAGYYAARQDVLDDIAEAAKDLADEAQSTAIASALVGNPNLIPNGWRAVTSEVSQYNFDTSAALSLEAGKTYTLTARGNKISGTSYLRVYIYKSGWTQESYISITETSITTKSVTITPISSGTFYVEAYNFPPNSGNTTCYLEWVMLQEGTVYIDQNTTFKQTALEDVANKENLLENSVSRSLTAGGADNYASIPLAIKSYHSSFPSAQILLLKGLYTITINGSTLSSGSVYSVRLFNISTWSFTNSPLVVDTVPVGSSWTATFRVPSGNFVLNVYAGVFGATAGKTITIENIMLQYGPFSTPWKPCLNNLTTALQGTTEIDGGLILSNLIAIRNALGTITAGISGVDEDITLWGGATYAEAVTASEGGAKIPVLLTKAGDGSNIGCLEVVDEDTVKINNGEFIVTLTTKTIAETVASLETVTLHRTAALNPVSIGNNTLVSSTLTKTATYNRFITGGTIPISVSYGPGYTYFGEDFMFYVVVNGVATQIGNTVYMTGLNPAGAVVNRTITIPRSVLDFAATAGWAVSLRLTRVSYSEGGTPSATASFSNCKTEFAEVNKQMIIANDGFCVSKDAKNVFKIYGDSADLALSFNGKIGSSRGTLSVDGSGFLKLT